MCFIVLKGHIMKILLIHHCGNIGGGTLSCLDVACALKKNGVTVKVALPRNSDKTILELFKSNNITVELETPEVPCFTYHSASMGFFKTTVKYLIVKHQLFFWKKYFSTHYYDYVFLNSSVQWPLINVVKEFNIKCVCIVRETLRKQGVYFINRLIVKKISRADSVFFLTYYDKKEWNLLDDVCQKVIPDVVNFDSVVTTSAPLSHGRNFNLVYLGGINYVKGILDLVQAIDYLNDNDIKLYILGDTGEKILHTSFIKQITHYEQITFIKRVYNIIYRNKRNIKIVGNVVNVSEFYRKADLIVFPVKKVHQARPIYEAGMYKKTILVPDYKNFKESVINYYNGLIYKKNDYKDLAEKIMLLKNNKNLLERLSLNNYNMSKKNHNKIILENELKCFLKILE